MFNHSQNITIHNGQFTNNIGVEIHHDAVSTTLLQHIAAGAMFDSAERYPPGKCHPGTQRIIMQQINGWILNYPNHAQSFLWLYGSAGCGKSAIMQSMCESMKRSHPERYAGSFFFARGHADRGMGVKLFTTLSYQLAIHFPSLRNEINNALYDDSTLPTKSMDVQLRTLILEPLLRCKDFPTYRPIIVIDGLDECGDDQGIDTQRQIIALIVSSVVMHRLPVRFMIASRPEYWIRTEFEASPLANIALRLSLRPSISVDGDIRLYLAAEFERIRRENLQIMGLVKRPWPPANVIDHLVREASGQFIYASTVLKFVGKTSRFIDPQRQLHLITTPGPHRASAFTELDRLYATILSVYPDRETMKRVLAGLLAVHSLTVIEVVLGVDRTEIILVLEALNSLINVIPALPFPVDEQRHLAPIYGSAFAGEDKVSFCHLSFREFLQDETRSGPYHIDFSGVQVELTRAFFTIIHHNIDRMYEKEPHVFRNIGLSSYHRIMTTISSHSTLCRDAVVLLPLITDMTARLRLLEPDTPMKHPACFIQDMKWVIALAKKCHEDYSTEQDKVGSINLLLHSICDLRDTAILARKNGIRQLSRCSGYRMTPALMYMDLLWAARHQVVPFPELLTIPEKRTGDNLHTLQIHRHIIYHLSVMGNTLRVDLKSLYLEGQVDDGWLSPSEWIKQRVLLVCLCLRSVLMSPNNPWEHSSIRNVDPKVIIFKEFFNNDSMSDIHNKEYFKHRHNLLLLSLMVDATAWSRVLPSREDLWTNFSSLICPVLCWLSRQLRNPDTVALLEEYNTSLPQRMAFAMKSIFLSCFVPIFAMPYFSELLVSSAPLELGAIFITEPKSIRIGITPTSYVVEKIQYILPAKLDDITLGTVHKELFVLQDVEDKPIIELSCWYPAFASYILNKLAKYFYRCAHESSSYTIHAVEARQTLYSYITQCLPLAETSRQNLDALRALKHLTPPQAFPWFPPPGFCSITMEFLKRYEHSILSSDELCTFETWLNSVKHLETRRNLSIQDLGSCRTI